MYAKKNILSTVHFLGTQTHDFAISMLFQYQESDTSSVYTFLRNQVVNGLQFFQYSVGIKENQNYAHHL